MEKKELIEKLVKLKKLSVVYQLCNEDQRGRLLDASQKILNELEAVGYDRAYLETLLVSGEEFINSLRGASEAQSGELKLSPSEFGEVVFKV